MLRSRDGDAWDVLVRSAGSMLIATGSCGRGHFWKGTLAAGCRVDQKEPRVEGRWSVMWLFLWSTGRKMAWGVEALWDKWEEGESRGSKQEGVEWTRTVPDNCKTGNTNNNRNDWGRMSTLGVSIWVEPSCFPESLLQRQAPSPLYCIEGEQMSPPKYATLPWLFWVKDTQKTAGTGRALWLTPPLYF